MTIKICKDCKIVKSLEDFTYRKDRNYYLPRCKKCNNLYRKQVREKNIEKYKAKDKLYYNKNKSKINERNNKIYQRDKDKIKQQRRKRYQRDKEIILNRNNERRREIERLFPEKKVISSLRKRFSVVINNKNSKTSRCIEYLCGELDLVKKWFEFNFKLDSYLNMNWENHGKVWEIDHVYPISKHSLNTDEDKKKCFGWFNLLPVPKSYNKQKSNKILKHDIIKLQLRVYLFNKKEQ
jgi:hypothetical protein